MKPMSRTAALILAALGTGAAGDARAETPKQLLAMADEIAEKVAAQRGLARKRTIKKGVLAREQIAARLMERVKREYTPDEIRAEERVLKRLGLLDEGVDYEKTVNNLLMEQVAGFYDPFAKELFIADWLGSELQRPAIAHEIAHALADQHFDLRPYGTPIKEDGDRQLARAALVEGDGTAAMLEFTLADQAAATGLPIPADVGQIPDAFFSISSGLMGAGSMPAFDRAPRYLRETLIFPYMEGLRFVVHVRRRQPWSAVNAIYQRPPDSTEQILHPEKYFAREAPVPVKEAPLAPLAAWSRLRGETLGEFQTRLWLETKLDAHTARRASEGWGGDRLVAYEPPGGGAVTVVLLSTWDSEADAEEFQRAVSRLLARRADRPEAAGELVTYVAGGQAFAIERRGARVLALIGLPEGLRASVAEAAWGGWRIGKQEGGK